MSDREPRIGTVVSQMGQDLAETVSRAVLAEKLGLASVWMEQVPNQRDTAMVLAALACATSAVTLGPSILPLYSRPPVVMAQSALTLDEVSGGRLILGLGLGHRGVGEWMVGATARPAVGSMREYLAIVTGLIRDGEIGYSGQWYSGHASYSAPRRDDLPVYVGTFGPRMLELAAEMGDGVLLWMCTPRYVREHAMPALRRGWARRGGRPAHFAVVTMVNAAVTDDVDDDRRWLDRYLSAHLRVPTYRKLFETSGFGAAASSGRPDQAMLDELGVIGGPADLARAITAYLEAGATEVVVSPIGSAARRTEAFTDTLTAAADYRANPGPSGR